jgi:hypothetical protein
MTVQDILLPVFVQVALTFILLFSMGIVRGRALRRRQTRIPDIALGQPNWPPDVLQVANAYHNQFQIPLLFYVVVIVAWYTRKADFLFVVLEWLFVVTRLLHAGIHVSSNNVSYRFYAFLVGAIVLLVMWIIAAVRILAS